MTRGLSNADAEPLLLVVVVVMVTDGEEIEAGGGGGGGAATGGGGVDAGGGGGAAAALLCVGGGTELDTGAEITDPDPSALDLFFVGDLRARIMGLVCFTTHM
jgi:hypothetical protein